MRRGGFVQGHDVLAMVGLLACCALGWRLGGGAALLGTSVLLGVAVYAAIMLTPRRLHVELGCLGAIVLAAFLLGGGHLLHAALLNGSMEPGRARWATLVAMVGPVVGLSLLWAFFNRHRDE